MTGVWYAIEVVRREFQMVPGDYHATVTRSSDGAELIFISKWAWRTNWKLRRKNLDKAFARYEAEQIKRNTTYRFKR